MPNTEYLQIRGESLRSLIISTPSYVPNMCSLNHKFQKPTVQNDTLTALETENVTIVEFKKKTVLINSSKHP